MQKITIYGMGSPNVVKVLIALEEMELPYEFIQINMMRGDQYSDEFGVLTPNRKVPVIVDPQGPRAPNGSPFTLWESGAILLYLAERTNSFVPTDPYERHAMQQWLMFQMASIGPMFGQLSHFTVYAPQPEHAYSRARYATEVKRIFDVVESRLEQSAFLAGADYSIADMAAWPWLNGAQKRGADLERLPAVRHWIEAIAARPATARALALIASLDRSESERIKREDSDALDRYLGNGKWSRPELPAT